MCINGAGRLINICLEYFTGICTAICISGFQFGPVEGDNAPHVLPIVPYEEPLKKDPNHVLYVMKHLHSMTTADMRKELKKVHIDSR